MIPLKRYLWLSSFLFISACQKETGDSGNNNASVSKDVAYGNHVQQKMDFYLPANRSTDTTPVLILVHGGGWKEGNKTDFDAYVAMVQQRLPGYAIFNLNYRLVANGSNLFPTQENDIKAAVEFIYGKKDEYRVSNKFVLLGASAGGHLALLQGYKYNTPVKPKAIVSFFGPTDLAALYNSNLLAAFALTEVTGGSLTAKPTLYQQSSPAFFVTAQSPPTMLLQGGLDPLIPPAQPELLKTLLTTAGVPNQYVFYPNESHGWVGNNLNDSFDKIALFLKLHVK